MSDGRPVAVWRLDGGFLTPGLVAIRPPKLVVYGDGQVIADAAHTLRLPAAELTDLITALDHDLAGQPATATPKPGSPAVTDVPTTVFGVRTGTGPLREVAVPAINQLPDAYPQPLYDANDRLTRLADRVTKTGQPYTSGQVRLVAEDRPDLADTTRPWPDGVPEPPKTAAPVRVQDLSADAAQTVVKMVPRPEEQSVTWPVFRAPSGSPLTVSWRYLVPGEKQ